jgi:hypothetical protein
MSANRVQYFIRSILQNSKLNREKFVNNKKKINIINAKNKNYNIIIKRKYSSSTNHMPPNFNNPKKPSIVGIFIMALGTYIATKQYKK